MRWATAASPQRRMRVDSGLNSTTLAVERLGVALGIASTCRAALTISDGFSRSFATSAGV